MAIVETGTRLEFDGAGANSGSANVSAVPADAEIAIVGGAAYEGGTNFLMSDGSMSLTKGGVDGAMTMVQPSTRGDTTSAFMAGMSYIVLPDTGSNMTFKWDFVGAGGVTGPKFGMIFLKGIDTASPVRGSGGGQGSSASAITTNTITALTGDLIVAFAGLSTAGGEGSVASWTNLALLAQLTVGSGNADGAWATGSPSGNTTVSAATFTNVNDGGIVAISLKPATAAADHPAARRWGGVPGMSNFGSPASGRSWFKGLSLPSRRPLLVPRRAILLPSRTLKRAA